MSKVVSMSPYAVEMPDGIVRVVRRMHDGPDFVGYQTQNASGEWVSTTGQDYDEYQSRHWRRAYENSWERHLEKLAALTE